MSNQIVQLIDENNNNIFPVAGSMAGDSVTTGMIQDEAVTADKFAQYAVNNKIITEDDLSPSEDTPTGWASIFTQPGLYATGYDSFIFTNQPTTYGLLETYKTGSGKTIRQRFQAADGRVYFRTGDVVGWYGSSSASGAFRQVLDGVYSTNEQIVGTWIDGKTIYRRVVTGTYNAASQGVEVYTQILAGGTVGKLLGAGGVDIAADGSQQLISNWDNSISSGTGQKVYKQTTTGNIMFFSQPYVAGDHTYEIWIEYTKNS